MNLSRKLIIKPSSKISLANWDADETFGFKSKKEAKTAMKENHTKLHELQSVLYAENKRSILIILQGMDASGKDGTIKHVMGPLNPQSCKVSSFKTPTEEELSHDFLWRIHKVTPRNGEIMIFNRSHYEDVLIVRVHNLADRKIWSLRYKQINQFEEILTKNDTHIFKFYLHISKEEQLKRFNKRLEDSTKNWKARPEDFEERKFWPKYVKAYEDALANCSTSFAPWFIIPANKKWFRNFAVSEILTEQLSKLNMSYPTLSHEIKKLTNKA